MGRKSSLTPEQWTQARRRWEGSPAEGFDWLAREIAAEWGGQISRQAVAKMAGRHKWTKGGEPSEPLRAATRPAPASSPLPAAAPVDLPLSGKPPGYAGLGRPSKYRIEYAQMLVAFFDVHPFREVQVDDRRGGVRVELVPGTFPMLGRFAHSIGVTVETLRDWARAKGTDGVPRYPEFTDAHARARQLQEALLAEGALVGAFDQRFAQFAMKNLAGWVDRAEIEHDFTSTSAEFLEATYTNVMAEARERQAKVRAERADLRGDDLH